MVLGSQGRLATMAIKASSVTSYSKVTQGHWLGDTGCLSLATFKVIWEAA